MVVARHWLSGEGGGFSPPKINVISLPQQSWPILIFLYESADSKLFRLTVRLFLLVFMCMQDAHTCDTSGVLIFCVLTVIFA